MRRIFLSLLVAIQCILLLTSPVGVHAQTKTWAAINPNCVSSGIGTGSGDVATLTGVECIVSNILTIGVSAIGLSAFVMLLIGAFMHLTSGGEPRKAETANKTITYAIVAILLSVSGWIIINFISTFTGVTGIQTFQLNVNPQTQQGHP
jgi:hypothetical protein